MQEERFDVAVADGVLVGHRGGDGRPALLLHGGPGLSDYTDGLAVELHGLFETIRYTQRGTPPSTAGPPYTVEAHMDDALAVLDRAGFEQAWAIGHSWGGHLALHLAVAHPKRLLGIICVDTLGASTDVLQEFGETLMRDLSPDQRAFAEQVEEEQARGDASSERLLEQLRMLWPYYFADPATAPPMPDIAYGGECSTSTWASISTHFASGTLQNGLRDVRLAALFVHGELDPLPVQTAADAAVLIPGAVLHVLTGRGHFPWLEARGEVREALDRFFA